MSGITWEMLTDVEREDLQFLVENGGGMVYRPRQIRLAELGLITGDDLFSIPTDAGRALVPTASGGGGAGELDPYIKSPLSRYEMLEKFYETIVSIDVLGDVKEKLLEQGKDDSCAMEAWADLEVLEANLSFTTYRLESDPDFEEYYSEFGDVYSAGYADAEAENEALRQQVAGLRAAMERIAIGANMPAWCVEHGIEVSDNPAITMQRIAAKALGEADNGS